MDDRKTRINKLSERFKDRPGRPSHATKERERKSYYLDVEISKRLDDDYKKFNHQIYPHSVSKSVFIESILEYGLNNIDTLKESLKSQADNSDSNE
jgi:hypothetical protein